MAASLGVWPGFEESEKSARLFAFLGVEVIEIAPDGVSASLSFVFPWTTGAHLLKWGDSTSGVCKLEK